MKFIIIDGFFFCARFVFNFFCAESLSSIAVKCQDQPLTQKC